MLVLLQSWHSCFLESSVEGNKLSCVFPYGSQPYGIHTMDWWTSNSLMLYWTHLYHKRTLWTLTLVWTLLNCPLSLFQNWFKGHWVLPNKRYNSIQIKIMHYPMGASGSAYSSGTPRTLLLEQQGNTEGKKFQERTLLNSNI